MLISWGSAAVSTIAITTTTGQAAILEIKLRRRAIT